MGWIDGLGLRKWSDPDKGWSKDLIRMFKWMVSLKSMRK